MDPRTIGERILQESGLSRDGVAQSRQAKENIDRRLDGLGLPPSSTLPARLLPGEEKSIALGFGTASRFAGGAASSVLFDPEGASPNPRVVPSDDVDGMESQAIFEPSDLIAAQAVTGLATTAAGGTEVRFNIKGIVHVGSGAIGCYWNRALGASQNFRWAPLAPGLLIPYDPRQGLFVGSNVAGGITIGGVLTLSFYRLPPIQKVRRADKTTISAPDRSTGWSLGGFREELARRTGASGSDTTAGAFAGVDAGSDVTLGTFSDAGVGTQIFRVSTNMPVGGATRIGATILNASPANTDVVWVAETSALAVASNGGISAGGQDQVRSALNGTLFMLAGSGTQVLGARYRS